MAAALLVDLLLRHGVRVAAAEEPFTVGRTGYPAGTQVIPAAQAYRAFLLSMLRPQRYPEVRPYVNGPILPPYDVTSWSLPISMGLAGFSLGFMQVMVAFPFVDKYAGAYRFSSSYGDGVDSFP